MTSRPLIPAGGKERRRFYRRKVSDWQLLIAEIIPGSEQSARQQRGIVLNVSESGVAVQPFLPLTPEAMVELRFGLPGVAKPFTSKGIVAWTGNGGPTGIQLIDPNSESRDQLRKWVESDLRLPSQQASDPVVEAPAIFPEAQPPLRTSEFDNALRLIARRAMIVTRASGVAIAIGDRDGMYCRTSIGLAPDEGVDLRPDRGISGYCLSSGKAVNCPDALSDSRVDPMIARQLEIGSILVVPVFAAGKLAAILEVLSKHRNAFDKYHTSRLEVFGALLGAALEAGSKARTASSQSAGFGESSSQCPTSARTSPENASPLACLWTLIEDAISEQAAQNEYFKPNSGRDFDSCEAADSGLRNRSGGKQLQMANRLPN